ncbi:uncharacterized protein [Amphiura filiformis]|uniref:uncharacterized protein n=1 Tax=Amphiura filiformis TaxID=82378 RepID=UPI003B21E4CC
MSRRAAIFLHAKDVGDVTKGKSSTTSSLQPQQTHTAKMSKTIGPSKKSKTNVDAVRSKTATPAESDGQKRRRAHDQARRPSTLPVMGKAKPPARRHSIRRNSTLTYTASPGSRRASIRPPPPRPPPPPPKEEPALTNQQIAAFKEVFDLFDSNGGGTIDSQELQQALASVDIHLSEEEIYDVLKTIDKDGSGEIDFEEFLTMMTNTEKFLEMFAAKHEGDVCASLPKGVEGREMILFDALTKFMRTSALKQMDEIVGYYNTKYKRAQAPHVVMHYAAGARLIGLTEKQLVQHMKLLQQSNRENNYQSPYAQPLRFILMGPPRRPTKKRVPPSDAPILDEKRCTGKIKLKIRINYHKDSEIKKSGEPEGEGDHGAGKKKSGRFGSDGDSYLSVYKPRLGWVNSHVKKFEHRLPATHFVTLKDLPTIRTRITDATRDYQRELAESKRRDNLKYWKSLHPEHIPSRKLRNNFRKVFNAYINLDDKKK